MSSIRDRIRIWFGDPGESLPSSLLREHRGMLFWVRASGTEDALHVGVADSSNVMQTRRILTDGGDGVRQALSDDTGWTSAEGAAMGSSPGSITQAGAEHSGQITQTTGASGTTTGILWTITLANNWGAADYNVFLSAQNAATAECLPYVTVTSGTVFTIRAAVAPATGTQLRCVWLIEDRTP